jgi:copper resistance protein C
MRKFITTVFVALTLLLSPSNTFAHVEITATFPEQYSNATPIPTEVWVEFSGVLQTLDGVTLNTLEVIDRTGISVNIDDPIIDGSRISTKISDQSAPGVFVVKYRVVGQDGHIIEGDYTFNASPDYSATAAVQPVNQDTNESKPYIGLIVFAALLLMLAAGSFIYIKKSNI